ncbi:hypothetical protein HO133_003452 [Letharia lupina]|uniref:Uncharacterized protein n=1 Tax=Letharia lupina TaxID=560253 RepID=A0A8H6CB49_9LECA|nr:uncharacterized protein HO133_003452 [Letharia lupina]KAF6220320.1 hypothetical protein HO133_003452 [Letharia lupina]
MDAYRQLPAGSHARSYGDRETQQAYDFPLPLRYASADGTCFIEVFPTIEGTSDLLKPLNLKQAVRYLIHKCVEGGNPEGGIAEKLGQANRLSVFVQRFEPNVDCFNDEGKPPFNQQCLLDLSYMPVTDTEQVFGKKNTPNIDVALPVRFADSSAQCVIDVIIDGPPVRAIWYDIWGSGVMVVAMCARFGRSGVSSATAGESELAIRVMYNAAGTLLEAMT